MVLEVATIQVRAGQGGGFEAAFAKAQEILASMPGYLGHECRRSIEVPDKYVLLVRWRALTDHTEGFRQSEGFKEWRRLIQPFFDQIPGVEHFESFDAPTTAT